tara:strand:- start:2718 stop:3695 length:978 start_codon:yes stop_codon:yes gene_type:complete
MFNKLSPTPITNQIHRRILIFTMIWFFSGAWIDSSAHIYLIDDIETFFTPWHGVLYSGYIFSVLVVMFIKNTMKDYKFDIGVLGAVVFGIGGASDAIWHTLLGIETGVEPLITPSHLMLFLGAFLMLDYIFTSRPLKETLDNASIFSAATSYGLVLFITLFINPFLNIWTFIQRNDELAAGSVILQAMLASFIFIYIIRFKVSPKQMSSIYLIAFIYISINTSLGELDRTVLICISGLIMSLLVYQITKWYQSTNNDRKIQVSAALVAGSYGLVFVLHLLAFSGINEIELSWRFYGLGGLITTPILFGYMLGNLGVSPTSGEVVS